MPAFVLCQTTAASQTAAAGEYRIAGTVVSKSDGHPLNHAGIGVVDVKNRKNVQVMITSEDGRFLFQGLPAGKYSLEGRRKGYIGAAYDSHEQYATAIVTGADLDTEHLVLRLAPAGLIAGKVLDESGEPVRHAMVTVYFEDHSSGIGRVQPFRYAQTDDEGEYEVTPLRPGTYFVSASATPWYAVHPNVQPDMPGAAPVSVDRSLDVTYPLTYYGDDTEADNASPIPIRGGERVSVDIHLSPAPALSLRFHVPENSPNGFQVPQLQQTGFDGGITSVQTTGLRMVSPGVMEITGIPAGKYNVRINGEGSAAQASGLDLNKEGQEVDLSTAEALTSVKISVNMPGGAEMPHRGAVALRSGRRVLVAWQQVNAKGEAELQQVPAGVYDVLAWNFGKPYSIDRMTVDGVQVRNHKIKVTSGSSPSISLTLVEGSVQVQGVVKRAGKEVAGAMVVLVPKDPELHRDRFRRDQSDLDGTFSLQGVVPGSYTVLAIDNGWELDWSQPGVIAAYTKSGRSVEIANQSGRPVDIGGPIEVQSR
ncbi:MAG: carboxypeptidase-like regulatory domain-containing protein [Silvibacterium sp.]